jgi:neutral ceramidase
MTTWERFSIDRGRARFEVVTEPPAPLEPVAGILAGAAEVDITPPPGLPKAGYSANAHTGNGFRTRLRARIVHLRAGTASIAVVQCDLLGGSAVLHRLVGDAIRTRTDVPLAGLFIGATHTHAGPGQFLGSDFYNRFASNKPGFDPAWAAFLVDQIAAGVIRAVDERAPARVAIGSTAVWGLTRNRSLAPHVRNPEVDDKRTEPQRKFVAINPALHLLRVDRLVAGGSSSPLAAAMVFSVHGTGISMKAREYNADVWAYICGELANRIEASTGTRPVVGAMEGTHADVAPAIRPGTAGHVEAGRVGRGVGAAAAQLYDRLGPELRDTIDLACGLREIDVRAEPEIGGARLATRPAVGAALIAGAHENTTPVVHRLPLFRPGHPRHRRVAGEHGPKRIIGARAGQRFVLPPHSFPHVLPVQVVRIGAALLVGFPFEITVEAGRRIEAAVAGSVARAGVDTIIVSSVVNEYAGYATTPEEYALQHYEGGHTIYGPQTQPFLAAHAARLAGEVIDSDGRGVHNALAARRFSLRVREYLAQPAATPGGTERVFVGSATFTDPTKVTDGCWQAEWLDVGPGDLHWHEPLVRVERDDEAGWRVAADDGGWSLQVSHVGPGRDGRHRYCATWWDPAFGAGVKHRFVLVANNGRPEVASDPFD